MLKMKLQKSHDEFVFEISISLGLIGGIIMLFRLFGG